MSRADSGHLAIAARLDGDIRFGGTAPTGPAVLVPIDVQALVLTAPTAAADVGTHALDTTPGIPGPPFRDTVTHDAGVHLHWAVPDGLTRGSLAANQRSTDDTLGLPALPDRWLVARYEPGVPRVETAWILLAEAGQAMPLGTWTHATTTDPARAGYVRPSDFHTIVGKDLAWAAVYDNAINRFAFHDRPTTIIDPTAPLLYLVVGWYSDPLNDPLHAAVSSAGAAPILDRLGWRLRPSVVTEAAGQPWRTICHGMLVGVRLDGQGVDRRPQAADISGAIGQTDVEALAALATAAAPADVDPLTPELRQIAFGYGVASLLIEEDGSEPLAGIIHDRGFVGRPGPVISEQVEVDDRLERIHGPDPNLRLREVAERLDLLAAGAAADEPQEVAVVETPDRGARSRTVDDGITLILGRIARGVDRRQLAALASALGEIGISTRALGGLAAEEVEALLSAHGEDLAAPTPAPSWRSVNRPGPRRFVAADPVIVLRGVHRSLRHGYDGRLEPDDRLACRRSGDAIARYTGLVSGTDLADPTSAVLSHPDLPLEARQLAYEAILLDPYASGDQARAAAARGGTRTEAGARAELEGEAAATVLLSQPGVDDATLLTHSKREGVQPSPLGISRWSQPWVPVYLEWRLDLHLVDNLDAWRLGPLDIDPVAGSSLVRPTPASLAGRSLLTSSTTRQVADRIAGLVTQAEQAGGGLAGATAAETAAFRAAIAAIAKAAASAGMADLAGGGLDGLRMFLLGFDTDRADASGGVPRARPPTLLRGGAARLVALRIVDAFGRTVDLSSQLGSLRIGTALQPPPLPLAVPPLADVTLPPAPSLFLAPRASRYGFASLVLQPADWDKPPTGEGPDTSEDTAIAAWLLPDLVDLALEVFHPDGSPVGQLRHDASTDGVVWEPPPGAADAGPLPAVADPDVTRFLQELLRPVVTAVDGTTAPSRLASLLEMCEITSRAVDPLPEGSEEFVAGLVGRPIAVVRATLGVFDEHDPQELLTVETPEIEAAAVAAEHRFDDLEIEVRLGSVAKPGDGLLGVVAPEDPAHLRPINEAVLRADDHKLAEHEYLLPKPVLVRPNLERRLLLLMEPLSEVTVTTGLLPAETTHLPRRWLDPLTLVRPSFRFGPVLVDPSAVRIPVSSGAKQAPVWRHRRAPAASVDDRVLPTTNDTEFPNRPLVAEDGWLREGEN